MKLKLAMIALGMLGTAAAAQQSHEVRGYTRSDGTYVAPHESTNADSTKLNNWTTQGNSNPYTGQQGTVNPYATTQSNPYGTPTNTGRPR